jgi:anion-transporting  ArsA/GET3 family ATPase
VETPEVALDLFSKRLLVVSGKGGVGKSVISSALALLASRQGKNVLLVKLDDQGRTPQVFGCDPLTDRIQPLRESVSGVNLDPTTVVADFFQRQLRIKRLVRHLLDSSLFQNWFRVSPAIKEMILLGKVHALVEESSWWSQKPTWDLVVFDAPATGHGLGYLALPEQASKLLMGPMRKNALAVQAMLSNMKTTAVVLVTIPEEMPVNEAIHFYDQAEEHLDVPLACVVLNAAFPERFNEADLAALPDALAASPLRRGVRKLVDGSDGDEPLSDELSQAMLRAAQYSQQRSELTGRYRGVLEERIKLPRFEVPYVFAADFGFDQLEIVAEHLEQALAGGPVQATAP